MKIIQPLLLSLVLATPVIAAEETALDRYVAAPDPAYEYHLVRTVKGKGVTAYVLDMTSQKFLTKKEVNHPIWKHWVIIVKPDRVEHNTGMLFIGGGSIGRAAPKGAAGEMVQIALATGSVVVELKQVPNEPLIFTDEKRERTEDAIIAYTWDKFLKTGDEKWPLRLPMTKAAVRAMDTVSDFMKSKKAGGLKIDKFVVAGASKRGWTTWSTAAVDKRVVAIAPIVIDMLNVVPSFQHHKNAYGRYSGAVQDYVDMKIMEWMGSKQFDALMKIEGPYAYRDRFTMPKFMINSCGDQFFLPDSWQFYWKDLKGPKHIRYVPNTGHGLKDSDALDSLVSYYHSILYKKPLPKYEWNVAANGGITVRAKDKPIEVRLWQATNPVARNFRIDKLGPKWKSTILKPGKNGVYTAHPAAPPKGWTAYMIELTFPGKVRPIKFTSGVVVTPKTLPFAK
jgi:PhoPQ-activated pathogenicity-related protein